MRFRTRLFIAWGGLVLLLALGSLWPVQRTIRAGFDRVARAAFAGTDHSLKGLRAERVNQMRQACELVISIPELRALIAESSSELTSENIASLQERLDGLARLLAVRFVCVLNGQGNLIAQNRDSPWGGLPQLKDYLAHSPQALSLTTKLYQPGTGGKAVSGNTQAKDGLWSFDGQLYQVVGVPLMFEAAVEGASPDVDGALIMATPLTNTLAAELARSHNCEVSFFADDAIVASSLSGALRDELRASVQQQNIPLRDDLDLPMGGGSYRSSYEPLADPCTGAVVGGMLIQSSLSDAQAAQAGLWRDLITIVAGGLAAAALGSFLLSTAVTRPVQAMASGVRKVAAGDLSVAFRSTSRGELGELARAFDDMVEQLRSRRQLQQLVDESRAASQAKSQFLANMSHEIRTPLHGVIGITDLLAETELDDQQQRYVGLVKSSAQVLTTLISDILDFSKIEAGKLELESIEFDVHQATIDVVELMMYKASAKGLEMACQIEPEVPRLVRGDPNRLRQIVINLLNNAIKFTESGQVTVRATREGAGDGRLSIHFAVSDTGIGIPPERAHRLFQLFSQVDASTTRKYGGTGLGLAICKQLAELMGGQIGVESQLGHGSTFWFTVILDPVPESSIAALALPATAPDHARHPAGAAPPNRSPYRILLAEDNEVNQIVATEVLSAAGYACHVVGEGTKAVEAVLSGRFDLVLMDCQMPGMDGLAATRMIRQHESSGAIPRHNDRRIPIIALTANASGADRGRCLEAGMDAYCGKPFNPRQLLQTIESLLPASPSGAASVAPAVPGELADAPAITEPPIHLEGLLERCGGKSQLAATVLQKFETQTSESIAQLRRCIETVDAAQLARICHALKGTAGIVAAEGVRAVAARMEEAGRAGDLTCAQEELARLVEEVRRCAGYIPEATAKLSATGADEKRCGGARCAC